MRGKKIAVNSNALYSNLLLQIKLMVLLKPDKGVHLKCPGYLEIVGLLALLNLNTIINSQSKYDFQPHWVAYYNRKTNMSSSELRLTQTLALNVFVG